MHKALIAASNHVMGQICKTYPSHSIILPSTAVFSRTCHTLTSSVPYRILRWRSSDASNRPSQLGPTSPLPNDFRNASWYSKMKSKPVELDDLSERQEEAAKAAILEKVMKGRQPTDLMLRCECQLETFQGLFLIYNRYNPRC